MGQIEAHVFLFCRSINAYTFISIRSLFYVWALSETEKYTYIFHLPHMYSISVFA